VIYGKAEDIFFRICVLSAVHISTGESSVCVDALILVYSDSHTPDILTNRALADRPYIAWIDLMLHHKTNESRV